MQERLSLIKSSIFPSSYASAKSSLWVALIAFLCFGVIGTFSFYYVQKENKEYETELALLRQQLMGVRNTIYLAARDMQRGELVTREKLYKAEYCSEQQERLSLIKSSIFPSSYASAKSSLWGIVPTLWLSILKFLTNWAGEQSVNGGSLPFVPSGFVRAIFISRNGFKRNAFFFGRDSRAS